MSFTIVSGVTYAKIECGKCGVFFALTEKFIDERHEDHRSFWCPNGHERHWPGESQLEEAQRLRKEAERSASWATAQAGSARRSAAAARGQVTKIKNRVKAGVCPFYTRHFDNLARHCATKHPDEESS